MTPAFTAQLVGLIRSLARDELLPRFARVKQTLKADGSILTEADLAMDQRTREELERRWPDVEFLSEEMEPAEQEQRLRTAKHGLWCVDPLDGTTNFAAAVPFFAVSVALIRDGRPQVGVVYDPVRDESFVARLGEGAWLDGQRLAAGSTGLPLRRAVALVDLKRVGSGLAQRLVREAPYKSQRNFGSCALEWSWIATGRGHVYLHGGQKLWDLAAGSLILQEAGGQSSTLRGEPVFEASLKPRSVVASHDAKLFREWRRWLSRDQS